MFHGDFLCFFGSAILGNFYNFKKLSDSIRFSIFSAIVYGTPIFHFFEVREGLAWSRGLGRCGSQKTPNFATFWQIQKPVLRLKFFLCKSKVAVKHGNFNFFFSKMLFFPHFRTFCFSRIFPMFRGDSTYNYALFFRQKITKFIGHFLRAVFEVLSIPGPQF